MSRQKDKGTAHERAVARYLRDALGDERIDRMPLHGAKDEGDIAGVRCKTRRVVIECKNCKELRKAEWLDEAQIEKGNADALVGAVCYKAAGKGSPEHQRVIVTMRDLMAMLPVSIADDRLGDAPVEFDLFTFAAILAGGAELMGRG